MKAHVISGSFLGVSALLLVVAVAAMLHPLPCSINPGEFHFHDLGWALTPFAFGAALIAVLLA